METTRPDDVAAIIPNRAQGYVRTAEGELRHSALADMSYKIPGGGLSGTAPDIARFVLSLSAGSLLKKDTLALMLSPQRTRDGRPVDYGLGVTLGLRAGRPEVWHTGGQERVSTIVYWQPNSGVVVVLLSNLEKARLGELARRVADQLNAP
jgi:CubicO group peptidase (beta-lactamase class C family)